MVPGPSNRKAGRIEKTISTFIAEGRFVRPATGYTKFYRCINLALCAVILAFLYYCAGGKILLISLYSKIMPTCASAPYLINLLSSNDLAEQKIARNELTNMGREALPDLANRLGNAKPTEQAQVLSIIIRIIDGQKCDMRQIEDVIGGALPTCIRHEDGVVSVLASRCHLRIHNRLEEVYPAMLNVALFGNSDSLYHLKYLIRDVGISSVRIRRHLELRKPEADEETMRCIDNCIEEIDRTMNE